MKNKITTRYILELAWPAIVSQSAIMLVGIIDLLFIGKIGTVAIAAVSVANIVVNTVFNFLDGIKHGTTVLVSKYSGANKQNNVSRVLLISLGSSIVLGIALMFIAYPFSMVTLKFLGGTIIQEAGVQYLYILMLSAPFTLIFFTVTGFFRGLKDTLTPLYITLLIVVIDAILDYVFIYGKFGFPKMGVKGAAIATLIAYAIGAIVSIIVILKHKISKQYFKLNLSVKKVIHEYTKISAEIGLYSGFSHLAICFMAYFFNKLGTQSLAIYQITAQVFLILYLPPKGFSIAASIITGNLIGAKQREFVKESVVKILKVTLVLVGTLVAIVFLFAPFITSSFSPVDSFVASKSVLTVRIVCVEQILGIIYLIITGALAGAEDTRFIMFESLFAEYVLLIPLAYLFIIQWNFGIVGGYAAFFVRTIFNSTVLGWRFFINKSWEKPKINYL